MLDSTDKMILSHLYRSAKLTIKELADLLNLSSTPVFERIKKLENSGYIKGYHASLDYKMLGYDLVAYCTISLSTHQRTLIEKFESEITQFSEVRECYHMTGLFDYLIKVMVPDMESYQYFLTKKLASLENIARVQSSFVMTDVKPDKYDLSIR
jgi:DNA-binding Lrp family transcriptional regulator